MSNSNHHRHHHSHRSHSRREKKGTKFGRSFVSFLLFGAVFMLSITSCFRLVAFNPNQITKNYMSKDYVDAMYVDAQQFAYDMCDACSIPTDSVDEVITPDSIFELNEAYILGNIGKYDGFNKSLYTVKLDDLNEKLSKSTSDMLKDYGIKVDTGDKSKSIEKFSTQITDYLQKIVEIKFMPKLQTIVNTGRIALDVLIVISAIITVILVLICLLVGDKKYRSVRAISYSFISASMLNFVAVIGAEIVKRTKTLYFFPSYLCSTTMDYINTCINAIFGTGIAVGVLSLVLVVVVWKLKRNENRG